MRNSRAIHTSSAEETYLLGKELGARLPLKTVVTLEGDLGAGKTTLIRGLVEGAQKQEVRAVCSPTFSLLNLYAGPPDIYHFDLYRLPRLEEFLAAGFAEYLDCSGICCIEWPEKIKPLLPSTTVEIFLSYAGEEQRAITIYA